jgi:nucleoid-associated protein YgaU
MASSEKVGFFVGLLFILVIALGLNSLSRPGEATGNSELTTAMVSRPLGIGREAAPAASRPDPVVPGPVLEAPLPSKNEQDTRQEAQQSRQYVVREGDTLWGIATSHLGDGRRYEEISRLNEDVLQDKDSLVAGMRLIMPAR